jgi:signal transduction histidine kinase
MLLSGSREMGSVRVVSWASARYELITVAAGLVALGTAVVAFGGGGPHLVAPELRAAVETVISLTVLGTALLLLRMRRRGAEGYATLLLAALVAVGLTDGVFSALPGLTSATVQLGIDPAALSRLLTPILFVVAAAGAARRRPVSTDLRRPGALILGTLALVGAAELIDVIAGRTAVSSGRPFELFVVDALGVIGFGTAAVLFISRSRALNSTGALLGAAAFLLGAARLQDISLGVVPSSWVTLRELLRLSAYVVLLYAVAQDYLRICRAGEAARLHDQREQIARDLHDGLAQDLAVIAVHAQRLESEMGHDHPLALAARRALAASRQTIVDLSATEASSTIEALCAVAAELEARFGNRVTVYDEIDRESEPAAELGPRARENAVRIVREAIVNASWHGHARNIDVVVSGRGSRWTLTISDDGTGIKPEQLAHATGFGLRTMRARAHELGGSLTAEAGAAGGTRLEVLVGASQQ